MEKGRISIVVAPSNKTNITYDNFKKGKMTLR